MAFLERVGKKYRVVWRVGGRGSPRRKSQLYDTKREAGEAQRRIALQNAVAMPIRKGESVSFTESVERFIHSKERRSERYEQEVRATCARLAMRFGWQCASDVRREEIKSLSPYAGRILLAALRYAADELDQPADVRALKAKAARAKRTPRHDALSPDQVTELVNKASAWHISNGVLARTIATYGHRAETLVAARVRALDVEGARLRLTVKNGDTIQHELTTESLCELPSLAWGRDPDEPLFWGHNAKPWRDGYAFAQWWAHSIAKGFGRPAGILDLRRYGISNLLSLGLDVRTVADITGHRTPSLLQNTYARSTELRRDAAIRALEESQRPKM